MNYEIAGRYNLVSIIKFLLAIGLSLFSLYTAAFGSYTSMIQGSIHLLFILPLVFLNFPFNKKNLSIADIILAILGFMAAGYMFINYNEITMRYGTVNTTDLIFGILAVVLVLEATRRTAGLALSLLAVIFILYAFTGTYLPGILGHQDYTLNQIIYQVYMTGEGIFGVPLTVAATVIVLYVLFGAFLDKSGGGMFFIDLANSLTGSLRGGPAKVAVVSSGLMGSISGSAVANVATTGAFTIPLMKKMGYAPYVAGAIEAVASTGGQIMPPVMGAVAFIMAEYTQIPYIEVIKYAVIPAFLYYFSVYWMVHLEAMKSEIKGLSKEERPQLVEVLKSKGHLLLPLIVLVYLLIKGYSPMLTGFYSIVFTIIIGAVRKETRLSLKNAVLALEDGAKSMLIISAACACAGIIIAIVTLTGIVANFSSILVDMAGGNVLFLSVLTAVASLIMGMGLPTAACYILLATMIAPALINLGVSVIAAHLFILYFGCISVITPPLALAAYTGAGIAGANINKTGFTAFKFGIAAYIVPFMFIFGPSLLWDGSIWEIITTIITSLVGITLLACGVQGWMLRKANVVERLFLIAAALCLIKPGLLTDGIGLLLGFSILVFQYYGKNYFKRSKSKKLEGGIW